VREHKFRIWDKKHETFVTEPFYAIGLDGTIRVGAHRSTEPERYELLEYTGLKDCKGQEIYKDDLLIHRYPAGSTIYKAFIGEKTHDVDGLDFGYYGVHFMYVSSTIRYIGDCVTGMKGSYPLVSELEIIGNVHENPELLESK
jgi:uncharacterized phage protein (TIGR01671 family)